MPVFQAERASVRDYVLIGKERHDKGRPNDWGYPIRGLVKDGWLYVINYEPARWPAGNPETGYLNCAASPTKTVLLESRYIPEKRQYWELSFGFRPGEELYHVAQDPACMKNLAADPGHARLKILMREELLSRLADEGDPRVGGNGGIIEAYPYADPKFKGFYEKYMRGEAPVPGWVDASDLQPAEE